MARTLSSSPTPWTASPHLIAEIRPARPFVPFFLASLCFTLSLGVTLGALNLLRLTGTWGALPRPSVWCHGYAQVFGFFALFIQGFAYHAVPRFVGAPLRHEALVRASLWLHVLGVLLTAAAFLMPSEVVRPAWTLGTALLVAGALAFAWTLAGTLRGRASAPFGRWMIAGSLWLVAAAGLGLVASVQDDVAWHHLLWPAALYGFVGSWILGAGRRLLPISLGYTPRWPGLEQPLFVLYQLAVAAWVAGAWPVGTAWRPLRGFGALVLLLATPAYAAVIGLWGDRQEWARRGVDLVYARHVRWAWNWLFVGLIAGPGLTLASLSRGDYGSRTMLDFSRHTVALGFATQMIVAIGSRFVPAFTGRRPWSRRAQRATFWLLNLAVAWRCLEVVIAAGLASGAWSLLGWAGPPAVLALLLFSMNLAVAMWPAARLTTLRASRRA